MTAAYALRYREDPPEDFATDDNYVVKHAGSITSGNAVRVSSHTKFTHVRKPMRRTEQDIPQAIAVAPSIIQSETVILAETESLSVDGDTLGRTRAERLATTLVVRPTLILDRGYQVILALMVVTLMLGAWSITWAPLGIAAVFLGWGSMVYVDATVRGSSVFDVRLAGLAVVLGLGTAVMAIVSLA